MSLGKSKDDTCNYALKKKQMIIACQSGYLVMAGMMGDTKKNVQEVSGLSGRSVELNKII